jgi:bifunctional DNA-binding transcriptional regulator/antitoxin component of YhaV-PrlF toxin-antitoxin module
MYEVIAKMDKQNRITIPQVVRELIGNPKPGDIIKVMVVGKVVPQEETVKVGDQSPLEEGLTA